MRRLAVAAKALRIPGSRRRSASPDRLAATVRAGRALAFLAAALVLSTTVRASAQDAQAQPPPPGPPPPPPGPPPPPPRERTATNTLYVEGLGPALLYSVNFDHVFGDVAGRVGLEYFSVGATNADGSSASAAFLGIPVSISYLGIGSLTHIFEVGAGATLLYFGASVNTLGNKTSGSAVTGLGALILGYRYQPPDGGFFFRAGLSPLISASGDFLPWPYLGLGATF
jgi:hypothetical protein